MVRSKQESGAEEVSHENFITDDGRVYILGQFDRSISSNIIPGLIKLIEMKVEERDPKIDIYINSCGGYANELFGLLSILDIAKKSGITIVTYNIGIAYSCGSILAIYGDIRRMSKYADNVAHLGEVGFSFKTNKQIDRQTEHGKKHFGKIIDIYAEHTKVPRAKIEDMLSDDCLHLDAKQCLKLGFCDEIF